MMLFRSVKAPRSQTVSEKVIYKFVELPLLLSSTQGCTLAERSLLCVVTNIIELIL